MKYHTQSDDRLAELLTLSVEVDVYGSIIYRNSTGEIHRIHGPAMIIPGRAMYWCKGGSIHRTDGLAVEFEDDCKDWYLNGISLSEEEFNERVKSV